VSTLDRKKPPDASAGGRGVRLRDAVVGDVRRAAELLETGLASLSRGAQTGGRNGRPASA
jgi:hypothetical protein